MFNQRGEESMRADIEHRPWLVMSATKEGFKEVARYRFRNDAEAHAQKLKRLCPTGYFTAAFEQPKISSR